MMGYWDNDGIMIFNRDDNGISIHLDSTMHHLTSINSSTFFGSATHGFSK
jgi:hypothetical protein